MLNIGENIETFIQARNVGAVTWGCTGVLNFNENTNLKQKASYESIWQHLEEVNKHKFIFGNVISLCAQELEKFSKQMHECEKNYKSANYKRLNCKVRPRHSLVLFML